MVPLMPPMAVPPADAPEVDSPLRPFLERRNCARWLLLRKAGDVVEG